MGRAGVVVGAPIIIIDDAQLQQAMEAANQAQAPSLIVSVFQVVQIELNMLSSTGSVAHLQLSNQ